MEWKRLLAFNLIPWMLFFGPAAEAAPQEAVTPEPAAAAAQPAEAAEPSLLTAAFWQAKLAEPDAVVLKPAQIRELNAALRAHCHMGEDLAAYPATISGEALRGYIQEAKPEQTRRYSADGQPLKRYQYLNGIKECAEELIPAQRAVRYAVTVRRADLRYLPLAEGWYDTPEEIPHYDALQGLALEPAEPVAVLHVSRSGKYVFVASRDYRGWVDVRSLAFTDREHWLRYVQPEKFLVVTKNVYVLPVAGETLLFQMGSRIPVVRRQGEGWLVRLPRAMGGGLSELELALPASDGVHEGYLPYTRRILLQQAFGFLGDVYGWGGQDNSVDCSSFVAKVYRTVGVELPGDSDRQEQACLHSTDLQGKDAAARQAALDAANPGDLLFRHGHVMFYLGEQAGVPMVIQSSSSYYMFEGEKLLEKVYVRRVLVSGLGMCTADGRTNFEVLTSIGALP